jgi:flagellar biosynthetic protein FlhB
MADSQNRNLPASGRKISKARRDGQVARSRDLGHLAALGVGGAADQPVAASWWTRCAACWPRGLRFDARALAEATRCCSHLMHQGAADAAAGAAHGRGRAGGGAGRRQAVRRLELHAQAPAAQVQQAQPARRHGAAAVSDQLVETLKSCLLATVLLVIGGSTCGATLDEFTGLVRSRCPPRWPAGELLRGGLMLLLLALAAFALIDVPLQRWRLRNS